MSVLSKFKSVLIRLISSYIIIVVLVSATIGIFTYCYSSSAFKTEIINYNEALMKRVGESVERRVFSNAESVWLELTASSDTMSLFLGNDSNLKNTDYYNAMNELQKTVKKNSDFIYSIDAYSKSQSIVLSTADGIKFLSDSDEDYLLKYFKSSSAANLWTISDSYSDRITFIRTVPYIKNSASPVKSFLAINVKADAVKSIITQEIDDTQNHTYIINETGEVIIGDDRPKKQDVINKILKNNQIYFFNKSDSDKSTVSAIKLGNTQTYLVKETYFDTFYKKLVTLRRSIISICILFCLIGILFSCFFAREIYRPLKNIVSNIKLFIDSDNTENEYAIIDDAINNLAGQVNNYEHILDKNRDFIKNEFLQKILLSDDAESGISEYLDVSGINFDKPLFCAVHITLLKKYVHNQSAGSVEYMRFSTADYLNKLSDNQISFYGILVNSNNIAALVNSSVSDFSLLTDKLKNAEKYCSETFGTSLIFGLGFYTDSIESISDSYSLAYLASEYSYLQPEKRMFIWSDYQNRSSDSIKSENKLNKKFYDKLQQGKPEEIKKFIKEMCDGFKNSDISYQAVKYRQDDILSILMSYMVESSIDVRDIQDQPLFSTLKTLDTIDEFADWISEITDKIFSVKINTPQVKISSIILNAKKYIDDNIGLDLSLSMVAEKFYISATYFSKMFKEETGINFNNYVTEKKLELARDLLLNTKDSLKTITQKTGFNSVNYFTKKFKDRYGDSPGNYKRRFILDEINE